MALSAISEAIRASSLIEEEWANLIDQLKQRFDVLVSHAAPQEDTPQSSPLLLTIKELNTRENAIGTILLLSAQCEVLNTRTSRAFLEETAKTLCVAPAPHAKRVAADCECRSIA
jgi:hypothetical protein